MSEPSLDPHTDHLLDERVRVARMRLHEAFEVRRAPALRGVHVPEGSRSMLVAAVAVAVALVGGVAALAAGQGSPDSTTIVAAAPAAEEPPTTTDPTATVPATTSPVATTAPVATALPPVAASPPDPVPTSVPAQEPPAPPETPAEPALDPRLRLIGRTFTGTSVTEGGRPRPLVDGTDITVTFEDNGEDLVRWNGGCNTFGAAVGISADRLDLGADGGSSGAGCPPAGQEQDDWLRAFFYGDPFWSLADGTLTLTVGDTVMTLEEQTQT